MKKGTGLILLIVIVIIAIVGIVIFNQKKVDDNGPQQTKQNVVEDKDKNENQTDKQDEIENEEGMPEDTAEGGENEETDEKIETVTGTPQEDEQKALRVVTDDWDQSGAAFYVDGMDENGNYKISVRDAESKALAYYVVNIKNNEVVSKKIIN